MSLFWSNWDNWSNWNNFSQLHSSSNSASGSAQFGRGPQNVNEQTAVLVGSVGFTDHPSYSYYTDANGNTSGWLVGDITPTVTFTLQNPLANETLGFDTDRLANYGLTLVGTSIYAGATLVMTVTETIQNGQVVAISGHIPVSLNSDGTSNAANQQHGLDALSSITYEYLGDNPPAGDRSILVYFSDYGSATTLRTVHVQNVNDGPVLIGAQGTLSDGFQDIAYAIHGADLLTGFGDPENDSLSIANVTSDHGAVSDNGDGTFSLTPDSGYTGIVTLTYHVIDGNGGDTEATLTLALDAATVGGAAGDLMDPGTGAQSMLGLAGDDTYIVDDAGDIVVESADEGMDTVRTALSYTLTANVENLVLTGSGNVGGTGNALDNVIAGNDGANSLSGLGGDDQLDGGKGDDVMHGGSGNDTYVVDTAGDVVSEETVGGVDDGGTDLVLSQVDFTLGAHLENLTLTGGDDVDGAGNSLANVLTGNSGDNMLTGGGGNDRLDGGGGADLLMGGTGNDTYVVANGDAAVYEKAGQGTDLVLSSVSLILSANVENLVLQGPGDLRATGNSSANSLTGNIGNNILDGGAGADIMHGGAGNDTYYVDNTSDIVSEQTVIGVDDGGTDRINATVSFVLPHFVESLYLTGSANIDATGNDDANHLYGNTGSNTLFGLGGNDHLSGGGGADIMYGGAGNDTYYVDNTSDIVSEQTVAGIDDGGSDRVNATVSFVLPQYVESIYLTGSANIDATGNNDANHLYGNTGNNTLFGLGGNDHLSGGTGADVMFGGAGNDTYYVDNSSDVVSEQTVTGVDDGGSDRICTTVSFVLPQYVESLYLTGSANIDATGNDGSNHLYGNSGDNFLNGMAGTDYLTGGAGSDTFVFTHIGGLSGVDRIADFSSGSDHLLLTASDFGFEVGHVLSASELSLTGTATTSSAQFVYNPANHALYWDSNGSAAGGLTAIALFTNGAPPHAADFLFG